MSFGGLDREGVATRSNLVDPAMGMIQMRGRKGPKKVATVGCAHGASVLMLAIILLGAVQMPAGSMGGTGAGDSRAPAPMAEEPVWADGLDDLSHVYVPEGGLVNVEVVGGEARLVVGQDKGWIASSIIACPPGYRYDVVHLEADLPGASQIQISVLNASKESSGIGFANETIPPHVEANGTYHSVYDIPPWDYPAIRLQVNFVASGTDRPRLQAWSLHYVGLDEWCDEFLGEGKMSRYRRLNFTGGALEINLTGPMKGTTADYEPYPILALANLGVYLMYPNGAHSGYEDMTSLPGNVVVDATFSDINGDGILDLVAVDQAGQQVRFYWGSSDGTYSESDKYEITIDQQPQGAATGDFNGDGWIDVAVGMEYNLLFFLNGGDGSFNPTADISMDERAYHVRAGDFNGDGYDDIVSEYGCIHYGGSDGPGAAHNLTGGLKCTEVKDLNHDGFCDIIRCSYSYSNVEIYLGDTTGMSMDVWLTFNLPFGCQDVKAGDVNGDGFVDIVVVGRNTTVPYPHHLIVFEGTKDGWVTSSFHTIMNNIGGGNVSYGVLEIGDVDKDGYDDVLAYDEWFLRLFKGRSSWPSSPSDIEEYTAHYVSEIGIAIPRSVGEKKTFAGSFTTTGIELPADKKWDIVHLDGKSPQNTSISLSVLDGSGKVIKGYKDLDDTDVDLSSIILERTIRIEVTLRSEFNWTTPVLDRISVKWIDKGCWHDEFYGPWRTERTLDLDVTGGQLQRDVLGGAGPQLLFPSLRGDEGYNTSTPVFLDGGGGDYISLEPMAFNTRGVAATDATDINGDGFLDIAFAVHRTADGVYRGGSPLFLGSPVGWKEEPDYYFGTTGAMDVLLRDLNADGRVDVVFAQEQDGTTYRVDSTLFWGSETGWNASPDVEFQTSGASDVEAGDIDGDGRLDLVFACYRDASSTSTDSMVFLQGASGFCGTVPSHRLATKGARAVAIGDIDSDGHDDVAFANSVQGGITEIDSYVYWGKAGGGFEASPTSLRTVGAHDVKVADLDGDGVLDLVFANQMSNTGQYIVDSYVYLGSGTRTLPSTPSARLPTRGAVAVTVADLDGAGRKDLVFACQHDGTKYNISSCAYLGGTSGWPSTPSFELPTQGASDVLVAHIIKAGQGGYLSKAIQPEDVKDTSGYHTLRYTAQLGAEQSGSIQLVDATTWEVLAETALEDGTHEWAVKGLFWLKEHSSVRVMASVMGLDKAGEFTLDNLWLNWTKRARQPPQVLDLQVSPTSLLRLHPGTFTVNVTDEYDPAWGLRPLIEHRLNGTTGPWAISMLSLATFSDGSWLATVMPKADVPVGTYDLRVEVRDSDYNTSGKIVFPNAFKVLNNVPTAPEVRIEPDHPMTTSTIQVLVTRVATDVEESALIYRYQWYRDGVLVPDLTTNMVLSTLTTRGENWSVEVRAFDGLDEGPAGTAWIVIGNAGPMAKRTLADPEMAEDTVDDNWIDLSTAFEDPDGDHLTWSVDPAPEHIQVTIEPATGKVTLRPAANWNGKESATFIASDGQLTASQTVLITVTPVNDVPWFTTVNGEPITADPVYFDTVQGGLLVIHVGAEDVEGDALSFAVNTTAVRLDAGTGEIRFQPGNDAVGTLRFTLTMSDAASPGVRVHLNFTIDVENRNDPMDAPVIMNPADGSKFKVDKILSLIGSCTDPDTVHGQVLNFSWYANATMLGFGSSRTVNFTAPGTYIINLTVSDGEFQRSVEVTVTIEPRETSTQPPPPSPPPTDGGGKGKGIGYGLIAGVVVIVAVAILLTFLLLARGRSGRSETEELSVERQTASEQTAAIMKGPVEKREGEAVAAKAVPKEEIVIESLGPGGEATQVTVKEMGALAMAPRGTEAASKETEQLFKEVETKEAQLPTADAEALRIENLKRKYQTAIGRLPYGIPSAELKDRDWNELAATLATGEKKMLPDGREVTAVGGRWYYSDPGDSSTFLKEHGAKPKAEEKKPVVPTMDKATILAKLEERLAMGEISEGTYKQLRKKYEE
jgi:uncharacterized membrane protein